MIQFLESFEGKDTCRPSMQSWKEPACRGMTMALYLREAGPADAPCIIFLHGLWVSSAMWQPQIERLSPEYHCLAPDLPEHGQSTDIGLLTLENTSRVLANLIREQTPHGRAHVVGLSLGGSVALGLQALGWYSPALIIQCLCFARALADQEQGSGTHARDARFGAATSRCLPTDHARR